MAYFVIAYERPTYVYEIVEAASEAELKSAPVIRRIENAGDECIRTKDYDSGPWSTLEKAEDAIESGRWNESDD